MPGRFQETWSFFDKYGEAIALTAAQVLYDKAVPNFETATQGYYEYPGSFFDQKELIPCWIFEVEYYKDDQLVTKADTFIPAAESYFPPVATIIKPAEFQTFDYEEPISFDCQIQAGFGTKPYRYEWESDVDGLLSTEQRFESSSLSVHCPDSSCDCGPLPHTISLTVTDAKGSKSADAVQIIVRGRCDECTDCSDLNHDNITDLKDLAYIADRYLTRSIPGAE